MKLLIKCEFTVFNVFVIDLISNLSNKYISTQRLKKISNYMII